MENISAAFIDTILEFDSFLLIFFIVLCVGHVSEPYRIVTSACLYLTSVISLRFVFLTIHCFTLNAFS